jgi:hypothetical protein
MLPKRKVSLILFFTIIIIAQSVLSIEKNQDQIYTQEKIIHVTINNDGTTSENILWKIKVTKFFSGISPQNWAIQVPMDITDIKILENNNPISFTLNPLNEKFQLLTFQNHKKIRFFNNQVFNISFIELNNPIISEEYSSYRKTFKRFETDNEFSITITFPRNARVFIVSPDPISQKIKDETRSFTFNLNKGETKTLELDYQNEIALFSPEEYIQINTEHYYTSAPIIYENQYQNLLTISDKAVNKLEEIYGFPSPYKWKIEPIEYNDPDFNDDTEAYYAGDGNIRIKSTHLRKTEKESLYIIIHETIHGFNSIHFPDEIPNFWWNEGTAQAVSLDILDSLQYNTEEFRKEKEEIIRECKDQNLTFFPTWSPNKHLGKEDKIFCNSKEISLNQLGYALSYKTVLDLSRSYPDLFQKFHKKMKESPINLSKDHKTLNNEMNTLLSKALSTDQTTFLKEHKILDSQNSPITGLPIIENKSEFNQTLFILFILAATMLILVIVLLRKLVFKRHSSFN